MGLSATDARPEPLSLRDAYGKVRDWYRANAATIAQEQPAAGQPDFRPAAAKCLPLVGVLPDVHHATELEMHAVFSEVIMGRLEWAYHKSDGAYKMAAYAHTALDTAKLNFALGKERQADLRRSGSVLVSHLSEQVIGEV